MCSRRSSIHFHRSIEVTGGERDQKIFRVELAAHAEATTDIAFDEVDGGFRQTDLLGQHAARGERNLCGAVDSQVLFLAVPRTDEAARPHGRRGMSLGVEALAADIEFVAGRGGERGIGVTKDGRVGQRKLVPVCSNSSDWLAAAVRVSTQGGRVSISTAINSSASSAIAADSATTTAMGSPT